jgi:hypothetical protein
MPLQKRRLTRIKSKKKTNHKKIAIVKKTAVLVEITNPDKIKQIQGVFENTNTQIIKLREIKDPIIEKKLRHQIFLQFEKRMVALEASLSFQKTKGDNRSSADKFYQIIARDYYNHTIKALTSEKIGNLMTLIKKKLKKPLPPKKIKEYLERCYYESMFFVRGEAVGNSFNSLKRRLEDIPSEIRTSVTDFLVKEYMVEYNTQIKEYMNSKKIESDIVANAYSNLAIRISFLEML